MVFRIIEPPITQIISLGHTKEICVICEIGVQIRVWMKAIRYMLDQAIDYAGMYPPASLSLDEALESYWRHQSGSEAWMVKRMVLPVDALSKANSDGLDSGRELRFAMIPRRASGDWLVNLRTDVAALNEFLQKHQTAVADVLEILLPAVSNTGELDKLLRSATAELVGRAAFFEVATGPDFLGRFEGVAEAVAGFSGHNWGLKLRTGGTAADLYPAPSVVARALVTARDHGVPIKFTAGLHHPIRHWNKSVGTRMHGFINILMAGLLAHHHGLSPERVESILEEEEPSNFSFTEQTADWRDLALPIEAIPRWRERVVSFGSCSVNEPREDLEQFGWWE
jgi:hypothetical protein